MLSGFSFMLATSRHWEDHLALSAKVWRRVRRFAFFILLGFAMHFPVHRIIDLRWLGSEGWRTGLQIDVLQTIGATLILLQFLVLAARTPKRFAIATFGAAGVVVGISAYMWAAGWPHHLPLALVSYANGTTGSLFPLFPWSAYVLLGAAVGTLFTNFRKGTPEAFGRVLGLVGFGMIVAGVELESLAMRLYANLDYWHTSPTLFMTRAGVILFVLGIAFQLKPASAGVSNVVSSLAKESLLVYFVHVCVLYGSVWNEGLRQYYGNNFDLLHAAVAAAAMMVSVLTLAFAWNECKRAGTKPAFAVRALTFIAAAWSLS
jgi:uncharacterized membrane protein